MGVAIPTLCNYRGLSPYGACRVCLVEIETPRGGQLGGLVQPSGRRQPGRPHRDRAASRQSRQTVLELLLAQAPDSRELAEFAAGARRRVDALRAGRRGQVHPLRAVRPGLQRDDGPRARSTCSAAAQRARCAPPSASRPTSARPAGPARSSAPPAPSTWPRSPPGSCKPHLTGYDKYLDRPAVHRPGPSAGLAARAGHRPRELRPFQDRRVRPVRQGLPGRARSTTSSRTRRSNWKWAAWCSRPASRPSTPRAAASSASASPPTC